MSHYNTTESDHFALHVRDGRGEFRPATADEILFAARMAMSRKLRRGSPMSSPEVVRDYLLVKLAGREHEIFAVLLLDTRHRLIEFTELFRGTIDGASVHPREVVKTALAKNAAAIILVHNHPSGDPTPSSADRAITRRLTEALALVDVRVLDHLIVGADDVMSFATRGWI